MPRGNATRAWDVFNNGKWIDTVFYTPNCDAEYVLTSLINHDGYDPSIQVSNDDGRTCFCL